MFNQNKKLKEETIQLLDKLKPIDYFIRREKINKMIFKKQIIEEKNKIEQEIETKRINKRMAKAKQRVNEDLKYFTETELNQINELIENFNGEEDIIRKIEQLTFKATYQRKQEEINNTPAIKLALLQLKEALYSALPYLTFMQYYMVEINLDVALNGVMSTMELAKVTSHIKGMALASKNQLDHLTDEEIKETFEREYRICNRPEQFENFIPNKSSILFLRKYYNNQELQKYIDKENQPCLIKKKHNK